MTDCCALLRTQHPALALSSPPALSPKLYITIKHTTNSFPRLSDSWGHLTPSWPARKAARTLCYSFSLLTRTPTMRETLLNTYPRQNSVGIISSSRPDPSLGGSCPACLHVAWPCLPLCSTYAHALPAFSPRTRLGNLSTSGREELVADLKGSSLISHLMKSSSLHACTAHSSHLPHTLSHEAWEKEKDLGEILSNLPYHREPACWERKKTLSWKRRRKEDRGSSPGGRQWYAFCGLALSGILAACTCWTWRRLFPPFHQEKNFSPDDRDWDWTRRVYICFSMPMCEARKTLALLPPMDPPACFSFKSPPSRHL